MHRFFELIAFLHPARRPAAIATLALLAVACTVRAADPDPRLERYRRRFPAADANGDGILTEAEARAHQRERKQSYAGEPAETPFAADVAQSAWIHHVSLGLPLKARYAALGLECELYHRGRLAPPGAELAFLRRHLLDARREAR